MLRHLIFAAAIAVLPASLARAQITDITSGRPDGADYYYLGGVPDDYGRSRSPEDAGRDTEIEVKYRETLKIQNPGQEAVERSVEDHPSGADRVGGGPAPAAIAPATRANRVTERTDRCFARSLPSASPPSPCPRPRSNIRRARSASWSALPPAPAPTSRPAPSRSSSPPISSSRSVIENRLGANGTIAARAVATAAPDGLTLLFSSSSIAPTPHIYKNLGYDTLTDLRPVATSGVLDGLLMLVDAKSPIKSVPEFIAFAKSNRVLYGSPGVGNVLHLAAEVFAQKAGITMQHVPYKGSSEVMTALLGGSVQVMFVTPVSVSASSRKAASARSPSPARSRFRNSPTCR